MKELPLIFQLCLSVHKFPVSSWIVGLVRFQCLERYLIFVSNMLSCCQKESVLEKIWPTLRNNILWNASAEDMVIHCGVRRRRSPGLRWCQCLPLQWKAFRLHRVIIWLEEGSRLGLPGVSGCRLAEGALSSPWICQAKDAFMVIFRCLPWSVDCSILSFCRFCFLHGLLLPLNCT